MIKDLIQGIEAEASRAVYKLIERALWKSLIIRIGVIPPPEELASKGRHIKCATGDQFWDEWQWETKPLFRLHTKHNESRLVWMIEFINEDGQPLAPDSTALRPDTNL